MNVTKTILLALSTTAGLAACSSSSSPPVAPPVPPPPPTTITASGVVTDGPVIGGSLIGFLPEEVQAALDSVDPAGDRLAALSAAANVVVHTRDPADGDQYSLTVSADLANRPVFFVFDNEGAEDESFKDTPANLEAVVMLGSAGGSQRVNVSLQSRLFATTR